MNQLWCGLPAGILALAFSVAQAADPGQAEPYTMGVTDRLSLGTRIIHHHFLDDSRSSGDEYLGHLGKMDDRTDYLPTRLYARYLLSDAWAVELSWDAMSAELVNKGGAGDHDGELSVQGPILSAVYRFREHEALTPYVGAGLVCMWSDFDHEAWHHYGYSSKADWESLGAPRVYRGGKHRSFHFDDALGLMLDAGVEARLCRNWSLNAEVRYMSLEVDGTFTDRVASRVAARASGSFPYDHVALAIGVQYDF